MNWGRATFSPDARYVVAGAVTGSVFIWNLKTGKVETVLTSDAAVKYEKPKPASATASGAETLSPHAVTCVGWNPNGRQIASCDNSGRLTYWE